MRLRRRVDGVPPPAVVDEVALDGVDAGATELDGVDLSGLGSVLAPAPWLRDLSRTAWALLAVLGLIAAGAFVLAKTSTIVGPLVVALIAAAVTGPVVSALERKRVPRAVAAALVLLALVALAVGILLLVIGGISGQSDEIGTTSTSAAAKVQGWLEDAGVSSSGAAKVKSSLEGDIPAIISTLTKGIVTGIRGIASVAFGVSFAAFCLFFLLKDGRQMRGFVDRHLGVPLPVARVITGGVLQSLRGYFTGVTLVASFNAVVVGIGAWLLDVPLAGTIAVVTLVTAYVPFIGAVVAGAFAVILALGSQGTNTALIMLVIVILANGLLQNVVQPIAFGATLNLSPLVILVVTIGAGCLFGMLGLVLAAPLTSAAVHIASDLGRARARAAAEVP